MSTREGKSAARTAKYGMLIALAFLFSYIEAMIPIPGTAAIAVVRVVLVGFTFGNLFSMWYGLSGCILSLICMSLLRRWGRLGILGVSAAGGVAHNLGQLCMAAFLVENGAVFVYFPVLMAAGTAAGALIGLLGGLIVERLGNVYRREN